MEQENDRVGVPDKEVAAQLGLSLDVVCRRRKLLGLPRIRKEIWTAEVLASLGKEPDSKIAKRFGFHVRSVLVKRQSLGIASHRNSLAALWTEENLGLLGKISDYKMAAKLGKSAEVVRQKRIELGIPAAAKTAQLQWKPEHVALLGKMPDSEVARRLGVSSSIVKGKRQRLDILSAKSARLFQENVAPYNGVPEESPEAAAAPVK